MKCRNWEVGSTWYISPTSMESDAGIDKWVNLQCPDISFFSTCRSAISQALSIISDIKRALVPAFTCHSVIEPFLNKGIEIDAYQVKLDLTFDHDEFLKIVNKFNPQIILIHGYFGFNTTKDDYFFIKELMRHGIAIIEDVTQTMFSGYTHIPSTFQLGSIRKWLPIPDGAFITNIGKIELPEDSELSEAKYNAMRLKGEYIFTGKGNKEEFMPLFKNAELLLDSRKTRAGMSLISYASLKQFNINEFKQIRRTNYKFLSERLKKHPEIKVIKEELDHNETPFLLPVYIEHKRSEFQKFMASHNVYPTIIWTTPYELTDKISKDSLYVYDNIICFHIDQRYDMDDMNRVAEIVDLYFKKEHEE